MNSWPSVLPTESDLTWYLSDMCNFYYELSIQRSGFEWHYLYSDASHFPLWLRSRDTPFLVIHDGSVLPISIFISLDSLILWGIFTSADCDEYLLTRICRQSVGALSTSIETSISICSLAFGLITRRIAKWTPLSKSSFILCYSWWFCTPKAR